jgi:hypothetical protein
MKTVTFQVDTRLAKLLSESYRSTESALKELIDNAWDADSDSVTVTLPDAMSGESIVVLDDGTGMTEEEILREYLHIASDRRQRRGEFTAEKTRRVKGRKGIGKFAGLMAAQSMRIETWTRGKRCDFTISTTALASLSEIGKLAIDLIVSDQADESHGTRVTLTSLHQNLAFPNPDKFRQILLQEYGRADRFSLVVNGKPLGVDDISGNFTKHEATLPSLGQVTLRFTVSNQKGKLKQPGIAIRVGGKVVGSPSFFGLDEAPDFPQKLLEKIFGEVEADGLMEHVTADWGSLVENSELFVKLKDHLAPLIREKVREEYGREISLAQARLQKQVNERLAKLPEYKRQFADKSIKGILAKYVLLDALERSDYRAVLEYIHNADRSDIAKLAEVLHEFGLAELAILAEQVNGRLEFLDRLEDLCKDPQSKEEQVHSALASNLWVFGQEYSLFSSNKTLKRQVEDHLGKTYVGDRESKRPDLLLSVDFKGEYLLIEFKRPSHSLVFVDYQQAAAYRNDFKPYIAGQIHVFLIGGKRGSDLPAPNNIEPNTSIFVFDEIVSRARNQLNWLLDQLGVEAKA